MKRIFTLLIVLNLSNAFTHNLNAQTTLLSQNWSNISLISAANDWSSVPNIVGYRGDLFNTTLGAGTAVDPQLIIADSIAVTPQPLNVGANSMNAPSTYNSGGLYEFDALPDPVVAMQGSGTADAPFLLITIPTTGYKNIRVRYNLRDVDGGIDNSIQPVALQYRIGSSGNFTNVAAAFVADASSGPNLATLVTPVDVVLPAGANNIATLQLRIITNNAVGSDELIGIDDIIIEGTSILPVELTTFNANVNKSTTKLTWQTASEKNNAFFAIERSVDGDVFSKIGEVKGNGNSTTTQNYQYTDATPVKGINYYRLRQVDFDGTEDVSKTVSINFDGKGGSKAKVYPTLVSNVVNIELSSDAKTALSVSDVTGRVILTQNTEGAYYQTMNLGTLSSGLYFLNIRSNEGTETVKIYKQ
jgi:Secretion system C-terminal sorting domain